MYEMPRPIYRCGASFKEFAGALILQDDNDTKQYIEFQSNIIFSVDTKKCTLNVDLALQAYKTLIGVKTRKIPKREEEDILTKMPEDIIYGIALHNFKPTSIVDMTSLQNLLSTSKRFADILNNPQFVDAFFRTYFGGVHCPDFYEHYATIGIRSEQAIFEEWLNSFVMPPFGFKWVRDAYYCATNNDLTINEGHILVNNGRIQRSLLIVTKDVMDSVKLANLNFKSLTIINSSVTKKCWIVFTDYEYLQQLGAMIAIKNFGNVEMPDGLRHLISVKQLFYHGWNGPNLPLWINELKALKEIHITPNLVGTQQHGSTTKVSIRNMPEFLSKLRSEHLTSITFVNLQFNYTECTPHFKEFPNLDKLYLSGCIALEQYPTIPFCSSLRALEVHFGKEWHWENDMAEIAKSTRLQVINIRKGGLTIVPMFLFSIPTVKKISLVDNNIRKIPKELIEILRGNLGIDVALHLNPIDTIEGLENTVEFKEFIDRRISLDGDVMEKFDLFLFNK